ncbi:MAG: hypothetical protein H6574_05580 [Lewinellaceae bacterium]|nr:hypothetical protein [Saprospiraceae bacterium]MCB9330533.1 hypothetical protein [Lewinellaceae bacterium]
MKNVFVLSTLVFLGWCLSTSLTAQNCQPSPACKAICGSAKADVGAAKADVAPAPVAQKVTYKKSCAGAMASTDATGVQAIPAGLFDPGTQSNTKNGICNPANCDPSKCDPSKCDPSKKCDVSKCVPANCAGGKAKAAAVRL